MCTKDGHNNGCNSNGLPINRNSNGDIMKPTEHIIEDAVQWTIITIAIVACALIVFSVGNAINQSLMATGVL